jgi:hypothetical protein
MLQNNEQEGNTATPKKNKVITTQAFFEVVQVGVEGAIQCRVTPLGDDSVALTDHLWTPVGETFSTWITEKTAGRKPAYFSLAAFNPKFAKRFKPTGRDAGNCVAARLFCMDVDGGPIKWAKALKKGNTDGVYETAEEIVAEVSKFFKVSGLRPTFVVESGSGGLHLYYVLDAAIGPDEWQGRANALVALAKTYSLKIDAQCTTDIARIMRAPGSYHHITGKTVQAHSWGDDPMTLEQFDAFVKYDPAIHDTPKARSAPTTKTLTGINAGVAPEYPRYSYQQAAAKCGAMRKAAERNGRDTPYPVWFLALRTADLSTDGRDFAHEISCGHDDYDAAATDRKLDSLTGGPASCATWAAAYGSGGPCDSCEFGEA